MAGRRSLSTAKGGFRRGSASSSTNNSWSNGSTHVGGNHVAQLQLSTPSWRRPASTAARSDHNPEGGRVLAGTDPYGPMSLQTDLPPAATATLGRVTHRMPGGMGLVRGAGGGSSGGMCAFHSTVDSSPA
jgi:hypothetical protein